MLFFLSSFPTPVAWYTASDGNYFAAFKVPLDARFDEKVPEGARWTPAMIRENYPNLGMMIDLTKASPGKQASTAVC